MSDPLPSSDDRLLVAQANAGDRNAFGELVRRHQQKVFALAYGMLGSRSEAQDATQEVFVKALQKLKTFHGQSSFPTWIYRIAVNHCLDARRRWWRLRTVAMPDADSAQGAQLELSTAEAEQAPRPDAPVQERQTRDLVWRALMQLSEKHRAVVVLRELEELSYAEIAQTLGTSPGTVMSRLFYARRELANLLRGYP